MNTPKALKILILEDNHADADILLALLKKEKLHFEFRLVMTKATFLNELNKFNPDIILADNALPLFNATEALQILQSCASQIPFILVTGTVSEEFAAGIIKQGADDYILKDRMARLPLAMDVALQKRKAEKDKIEAATELALREQKYRTLIEHAFDSILMYSPHGVILDSNNSACNALGYTHDELIGLKIRSLFFGKDLTIQPLYIEALRKGETSLDYRRLKRKDGTSIVMEIGTKMMPDGNLMAIGRDITERKKAEEQKALFVSIVNSSNDAIVSTTLNGVITSWNKGAISIYGYTEEEVLGQNISLLLPKSLRHEELTIFAKIKKGEFVQHLETKRIKKDGSIIFISLTISPVRNAKGVIVGASKITRDISEKKQAEQKIQQSEENLKAIFENSSEGFVLLDSKFNVKAFNDRAKDNLQLNINEHIVAGKSIFEFVDEPRRGFFKSVLSNVMNGETIQYDRLYTLKEGKIIWINFTLNPVRKGTIISGICIAGRDITEKKIADQQKEFNQNNLHALINNTQDLMWSIDLNYKLITSNKAFDDMVHAMSGERAFRENSVLLNSFKEEQLSRYRHYYERAFSGESFTQVEHNYDPIRFSSEISFYPIYEAGTVVGTACFSRDITDKIKAEEELKNSFRENQELAQRMLAILNTLPANIALLDPKGNIVEVNECWRNFAMSNSYKDTDFSIGMNYINISRAATGKDEKDGREVAEGIENVLNNKIKEYVIEYPCHSPSVKRWFKMVATPLKEKEMAGAVVMHIDITEIRRLEEERLKNKIEEQHKITRAMLKAQEQERNQLGRELHDNISQLLAAVKMKLGFCLANYKKGITIVTECIDHVEEAMTETRNLSHRMVMPRFADNSFLNALGDLAINYTHNERIVTIKVSNVAEECIPAGIKETLYRIAQEQLHNIEKYAKASKVSLLLSEDKDTISMSIGDNGVGFDTEKNRRGIGITNIMNRTESYKGKAHITSSPGNGCKLLIEIPMKENCE